MQCNFKSEQKKTESEDVSDRQFTFSFRHPSNYYLLIELLLGCRLKTITKEFLSAYGVQLSPGKSDKNTGETKLEMLYHLPKKVFRIVRIKKTSLSSLFEGNFNLA